LNTTPKVSISLSRFHLSQDRSRASAHRSECLIFTTRLSNVVGTGQSHTGSSDASTMANEPSFVKLSLQDIDDIHDCFRSAEVNNKASCLLDLNQHTLCRFWEADWKLNCILERHIINGAEKRFFEGGNSDIHSEQIPFHRMLSRRATSRDFLKIFTTFVHVYVQTRHLPPTLEASSTHDFDAGQSSRKVPNWEPLAAC
jgi:hypothetical protein